MPPFKEIILLQIGVAATLDVFKVYLIDVADSRILNCCRKPPQKKFATVTIAKRYQWSCMYSDRRPYKLNWFFKSRESFLTRYI
ncbi:unnamed protein product [Tenebrio molitor]|nr:unnamed protein product [Tenebrio molitor]